jgi:hypothetical protein
VGYFLYIPKAKGSKTKPSSAPKWDEEEEITPRLPFEDPDIFL